MEVSVEEKTETLFTTDAIAVEVALLVAFTVRYVRPNPFECACERENCWRFGATEPGRKYDEWLVYWRAFGACRHLLMLAGILSGSNEGVRDNFVGVRTIRGA